MVDRNQQNYKYKKSFNPPKLAARFVKNNFFQK